MDVPDSFGAYGSPVSWMHVHYTEEDDDGEIYYPETKQFKIKHLNIVTAEDKVPVREEDAVNYIGVRQTIRHSKNFNMRLKVTSFIKCPAELKQLENVAFYEYEGFFLL